MPSWEFQRTVASAILTVTSHDGFALAGSGAIREHGLTDRPTHDVDLFTMNTTEEQFAAAIDRAMAALAQQGYEVSQVRNAPLSARLLVSRNEDQLEVDFGVDWRAHEPVHFEIGPVLAIEDAVANKVGALYSRAAARDFLDVDAIRQSERFTDSDLLRLAAEHDPGFETTMFVEQLALVSTVTPAAVADYGITDNHLGAIKERLLDWRDRLISLILGSTHQSETVKPRVANRRPEPPRHGRRRDRGISR